MFRNELTGVVLRRLPGFAQQLNPAHIVADLHNNSVRADRPTLYLRHSRVSSMGIDLANLNETRATELVVELLHQCAEAQEAVERSQRRAAGFRKMIDGLVEMFPAVEDLLPDDFDSEDPRPQGAKAVHRVLLDRANTWLTVPMVVDDLGQRGWLPNSSNPSNAVRTALERLVEREGIEKARSTAGAVIYRVSQPPEELDDEEPF